MFSAMLQGDMLEARESEITVTDVDPATFAALLHYAYTGELEEGQDLNNMIYGQGKTSSASLIRLHSHLKTRDKILKGKLLRKVVP